MSPACMAWTVADNPRLKVKVKWGGGHKRVKNWPKRRRKWKRKRINFHEIRRREVRAAFGDTLSKNKKG